MSIVGGAINGVTVGALQSRFGIVRDISMLKFITYGALAGFGGSMVSRSDAHGNLILGS
jgi:hypothetical protein